MSFTEIWALTIKLWQDNGWAIDPDHKYAYNPETGEFVSLASAGGPKELHPWCIEEGRINTKTICYRNTYVNATRVMWYIMSGQFPPDNKKIDHKDRDPTNNKWNNLRLATSGENNSNKVSGQLRSEENNGLPKGISIRENGAYRARIKKDRIEYTETFWELEDAIAWLANKRQELHGDFAYEE